MRYTTPYGVLKRSEHRKKDNSKAQLIKLMYT